MSEKHYLDVIERVVYVLELSDYCFYIGQAQKKSFDRRMKEHFDLTRKSRKSAWVKLHLAISIIETSEYVGTVPEIEVFENKKTIEYMRKYGASKVRGGYYTQPDYDEVRKCLKAHGYNVRKQVRISN
ncbi:MAG: hypothetical protein N4A62_15525 [Marinisporobacter sp.]|jgi:Uri superfamily endonuclease|nr:hypothetical protein [Marinisporobacter sp.]